MYIHYNRLQILVLFFNICLLELPIDVVLINNILLSLHADLTRQYKTMQSEMALRIHMLEQTVNKLREQLGWYLPIWLNF